MKIPRDPPSTKEILASIGSERVMELLDREDVAKFIEHTNEKYLYWDEIIFRPGPKDLSMEQLWALVKYTRRLNEKSISLFDDPGLKFRYMMNNIILERLHFFDLNMSGSVRERGTIPEN
ncbi:MAG: hypothetical protein U9R75_11785, partial [Candidatus Thermoplasmatota archaeon]|nr:hypothetical protein [Candidatus Thermoplasmatota archaeon]